MDTLSTWAKENFDMILSLQSLIALAEKRKFRADKFIA